MNKDDKWLIGLDFDGTVLMEHDGSLDEHGVRIDKIHPLTAEGIKLALEAGHYVIPVTGRNWKELSQAYNDLGLDGYAVMGAGGTIDCPMDDSFTPITVSINKEIINEMLNDPLIKDKLLNVRAEKGVDVYLYNIEGDNEFAKEANTYQRLVPFDGNIDWDSESMCINLKVPKEEIHDLKDKLQDKYGHEMNFSYWFSPTTNESAILINPSKADKGDSLLKVAELLGINPNNTLSMGDSDNDKGAVSKANIGVSMANAPESLKAISQEITDLTNDEGGVGDFLIKYFNLK